MIWIAFAAMTAVALALVLAPLWRGRAATAERASYDLEVYRDQLDEVERDLARGLIGDTEAEAARAEIGRRLLAADARDRDTEAPASGSRRRGWIAACVAVAVPALAALVYGYNGAPGLPGSPAAERAARAPVDRSAPPDQLIARLVAHLERNPEDAQGWSHLATLLMSERRYGQAAKALDRARTLSPENAPLLARYGEALTFAARGTVNDAARRAFESAFAIDAGDPRAGFYLGVAEIQAGRREAALARWRALLARSPADAPWRAPLRSQIARLEAELKGASPPPTADASGPTRQDVEEASRMPAGDRQAMIRSMVQRLADRLAESPDDADGWIRLGRSYKVLGDKAKSRDAYAKAASLRPDDVTVLSSYAASIADVAGADAIREPAFNDVIDKILDLDPNDHTALWFAGLNARRSGDRSAAAAHWRKLLGLLADGSPEHDELSRRIKELEAEK